MLYLAQSGVPAAWAGCARELDSHAGCSAPAGGLHVSELPLLSAHIVGDCDRCCHPSGPSESCSAQGRPTISQGAWCRSCSAVEESSGCTGKAMLPDAGWSPC